MVQSFRKRGPLGWNVGAGWRKGLFSGMKTELRERQGMAKHKALVAAEVCAHPRHSLFLEPRTGALEQGRRSQGSSWGLQQRSRGRREASRGQYPSPTCLP